MMLDARQVLYRYLPFLRQNILPLALGLIGLILIVYGLMSLVNSASKKSDLVIQSSDSSTNSSKSASKIAVDIEGAVVAPGLYRLNEDSRIQDLLILSNGLSSEADRNWVEKNLNLAARLSDGSKIYIPRLGEVQNEAKNIVQTGASIQNLDGLININTATVSQLDTLQGIGPVTADKIINNRPYRSVEELLSKKVLTSTVFSQIKDKLTVY